MRVNTKQLIGMPVDTKSGSALGRVASADFDAETGRIATLHVKARNVIQGLLNEEFLVDWSQIVEITEAHVVVQDTTVPEGVRSFAQIASATTPSGAQLSERGEG
jgi:sporulation protein YlmC with PRC-barrel domain